MRTDPMDASLALQEAVSLSGVEFFFCTVLCSLSGVEFFFCTVLCSQSLKLKLKE